MTKDKERESSGEMLQRLGMDGKLWAEEMHKYFPQVAEDDLLGWCCNMIMSGYDEAMRRRAALDTSDELVGALLGINGYASHDEGCKINDWNAIPECSCGYTDACGCVQEALAKHKQRKGE